MSGVRFPGYLQTKFHIMQTLTDCSKMEFGKYKGVRLKLIPAEYLLWFKSTEPSGVMNDFWFALKEYCNKNADILKKEAKTSNPPKYYGFMTFPEYLEQGVFRRYGIHINAKDCVQIISNFQNNSGCKRLIMLNIDNKQYLYFQRSYLDLLYTMDFEGQLEPSCFIYKENE